MSALGWSGQVSKSSHALELEEGVFSWDDPAAIARSLWESARRSSQKKRTTYGSAMAMLCFYINRAGSRLTPERRAVLALAKQELRQLQRDMATHVPELIDAELSTTPTGDPQLSTGT